MELTDEIMRDTGRFVKHLDTSKIKDKESLKDELRRSLPDTSDWLHPKAKKFVRGDWSKSKQRLVDRSEAFLQTDEIKDIIQENNIIDIRVASTTEDIENIIRITPTPYRGPIRREANKRVGFLKRKGLIEEEYTIPRPIR